jgi:hypothetical protein
VKKESFEERHGDNVSRLKLVLIVVCLIAIPVSFVLNQKDVSSVNERVTKVESPCLRYGPKSRLCKEAFEQAVLTITHAQACSILRKAGLEILNCRGARLKQERGRDVEREATEERRDAQTPSQGQKPGPPSGGPKDGSHDLNPEPSGVSNPPENPSNVGTPTEQPKDTPPSLGNPPAPSTPAAPSRGPLAPVLTPLTPPAAAPAVEHVCGTAAAVAPVC